MKILGIETSCDETGAAIVEANLGDKTVKIISNIVASSLMLHAETGGIIPEIAAREQARYIIPVIDKTLKDSNPAIDAIAITVGPGLIGSLIVGVETAKTLAYVWNKPIIPVNHLIGHIYANWIAQEKVSEGLKVPKVSNGETKTPFGTFTTLQFPCIALIVSGGHTDLVLMRQHGSIKWLGGTRDDAAGEAFDKIGRLLGLPYPGGPSIEKSAQNGDPKAFHFPRPMIDSNDFDFSFSGLKTAVLRDIKTIKQFNNLTIANLSASVQQAIVDVLVIKTLKAAKQYRVRSIVLGGGVVANQKLRNNLKLYAKRYSLNAKIFAPQKFLCTDNAAMIASAAFFNYKPLSWRKIAANPELYFD